jgi:hypothetical protein
VAGSLAVVGSGSLVHALCSAIATTFSEPATVTVIARSRSAVHDICYTCGVRAGIGGVPVRFVGHVIDLDSSDAIAEAVRDARPRILLGCASDQSPWESGPAASAWTALISRAGFGITLPLPARLAVALAGAVGPEPLFVNACFPDAVNPLLQRMALRDGVQVTEDGTVVFAAAARRALEPCAPWLADGFAAGDLPGVHSRMLALRDQLCTVGDRGDA